MTARCWSSPAAATAELKLGQYIHRKTVPVREGIVYHIRHPSSITQTVFISQKSLEHSMSSLLRGTSFYLDSLLISTEMTTRRPTSWSNIRYSYNIRAVLHYLTSVILVMKRDYIKNKSTILKRKKLHLKLLTSVIIHNRAPLAQWL